VPSRVLELINKDNGQFMNYYVEEHKLSIPPMTMTPKQVGNELRRIKGTAIVIPSRLSSSD
jgi:hypothetical protein